MRENSRIKISEDKITEIIKLKNEGKDCKEIAKIVGVHYNTVFNYTREKKPNKDFKYLEVIKVLQEGKTIVEAAEITNATEEYIRKIKRTKKVRQYKVIEKTERQKEIEDLNKERERQMKKQEKEWEEQLKEERNSLKERYPYAFK